MSQFTNPAASCSIPYHGITNDFLKQCTDKYNQDDPDFAQCLKDVSENYCIAPPKYALLTHKLEKAEQILTALALLLLVFATYVDVLCTGGFINVIVFFGMAFMCLFCMKINFTTVFEWNVAVVVCKLAGNLWAAVYIVKTLVHYICLVALEAPYLHRNRNRTLQEYVGVSVFTASIGVLLLHADPPSLTTWMAIQSWYNVILFFNTCADWLFLLLRNTFFPFQKESRKKVKAEINHSYLYNVPSTIYFASELDPLTHQPLYLERPITEERELQSKITIMRLLMLLSACALCLHSIFYIWYLYWMENPAFWNLYYICQLTVLIYVVYCHWNTVTAECEQLGRCILGLLLFALLCMCVSLNAKLDIYALFFRHLRCVYLSVVDFFIYVKDTYVQINQVTESVYETVCVYLSVVDFFIYVKDTNVQINQVTESVYETVCWLLQNIWDDLCNLMQRNWSNVRYITQIVHQLVLAHSSVVLFLSGAIVCQLIKSFRVELYRFKFFVVSFLLLAVSLHVGVHFYTAHITLQQKALQCSRVQNTGSWKVLLQLKRNRNLKLLLPQVSAASPPRKLHRRPETHRRAKTPVQFTKSLIVRPSWDSEEQQNNTYTFVLQLVVNNQSNFSKEVTVWQPFRFEPAHPVFEHLENCTAFNSAMSTALVHIQQKPLTYVTVKLQDTVFSVFMVRKSYFSSPLMVQKGHRLSSLNFSVEKLVHTNSSLSSITPSRSLFSRYRPDKVIGSIVAKSYFHIFLAGPYDVLYSDDIVQV